jgi:hypothetical protein
VDWTTFKEIGLFLLAVYAATLSTVNYLRAQQKDKRSIKVTFNTVTPTYGPNLGPPHAQLVATNSGHRTVVVTQLRFETKDGRGLVSFRPSLFQDSGLPATLEEGQSAMKHYGYADVAQALMQDGPGRHARIIPVCEDSLGAKYRGDPVDIDLVEWMAMGSPTGLQ